MWNVLSICVGASLGALMRWHLGMWLNWGGALPWGTVVANLLGAYLIGLAVGVVQLVPQLDPALRLLIITGFLGALTTFSSFSVEVVVMLQQQRLAPALGTVALSLFGSLVLTWVGLQTIALAIRA